MENDEFKELGLQVVVSEHQAFGQAQRGFTLYGTVNDSEVPVFVAWFGWTLKHGISIQVREGLPKEISTVVEKWLAELKFAHS